MGSHLFVPVENFARGFHSGHLKDPLNLLLGAWSFNCCALNGFTGGWRTPGFKGEGILHLLKLKYTRCGNSGAINFNNNNNS